MTHGGARKNAGRPKGATGRTFWSHEQVERFRSRIQADKIIQRLNMVASGEISSESKGFGASITAGLGLLAKVMPNLQATETKTEIEHNYVARLPAKVDTLDEWQKQQNENQPTKEPTLQ